MVDGAAGGAANLKPAWTVQNVQPLQSFIQSGETTCGQTCAAAMAQNMGFTNVTEQTLIDAVGTGTQAAPELANALKNATGIPVVGGTTPFNPAELSTSQMQSVVSNLTQNGNQPVMVLLQSPNSSLGSVGHWVIADGLDAAGNIVIQDPAGLQYTMTPTNFTNAWKSGALVTPSK